jgi:WD40 repeat protein
MSPEQAEFNASDIDTRTDIYALGVLLYELLVGGTPFDGRELLSGGLDAMRKIIREREPLRPSTRLRQTLEAAGGPGFKPAAPGTPEFEGEGGASTRHRQRIKDTISLLQGDLDWIVLKALEKDRTRRYDTANALAADIQRHLDNEPVIARPPSAAYKMQKAWQRNQLAFTAAAAVVLALVAGLGASMWQAVKATKAKKAETEQRVAAQKAEANALAKQREAEESRASEAAQRHLAEARAYAADMNLAQQALMADDLGPAKELLSLHQPQPGQQDRRGWEWRFLWQQSRSDALYTLCKQNDRIAGLSVSHDGKWLAVRTVWGGVSVWNLATRREVMRAEGNWNAVAFSPTTPRLALWQTGSPGSASWLTWWDAETGRFVSDPPSPKAANSAWKHGLNFLPDGQSMFAVTGDNLTVWRVSDGNELATHSIHIDGQGMGFPVGVAGHTNLVAVGEKGRRLRVIDLAGGKEIFRATTSGSWIETVALSGDGRILASSSGTDETVVHLWDVASGRELGTLEGHRGFVSALVFWPDGKTLASAGADKTIRIWDVEKRRPLKVLRGQQGEIHRLALLPDNFTLISGSKDGTVMVWTDVTAPRRQATTLSWKSGPHMLVPRAPHHDWAAFWSLASGGDAILTLERDGWLRRRHGQDFQETETLFQVDLNPKEVRFSADHRWLATRNETGEIKIWDVTQGKWRCDLPLANEAVSLGSFLTGTNRLSVWNTNAQTLAIHDVVTGHQVNSWSYSDQGAGRVEISKDGRWCLTSGADGTGHLRDLADGRVIGTVPLAGSLRGTFSPDGKQLAMAYRSGLVRRWKVPSLTEGEPFRSFSSVVRGFSSANDRTMTFSPDGRRLAVGSAGYSMMLWDVESGRPMLTFPGEIDHSLSLSAAYSADGSTIVVLHALGTFDIWRAPSWEEIAAAEPKPGEQQ